MTTTIDENSMDIDNTTQNVSDKGKGKAKVRAPQRSQLHQDQIDSLPWIEKYRPEKLNDLVSHDEITTTIQRLIDAGRLPHLLFYGPPGTGKTSTILAVARQLYGNNFSSMVLELNASDARGIDTVRNQIQDFAGTRKLFSKGIKLIILDEADNMTRDAQNALRRVIERYAKNARFCLICNYVSKIIPALQSRCTRFRFSPLAKEQVISRVREIITKENVDISEKGLAGVLRLGTGDMRKILNLLQSASLGHTTITEEAVYDCAGKPTPKELQSCMDVLLNKTFREGFDWIRELQINRGVALSDILEGLHTYTCAVEFPVPVRCMLLAQLADVEHNLTFATNEKLQLGGLVAIFHRAREMLLELKAKNS